MRTVIGLVVFLGNPGTQYRRTRHNVPWMLVESLEESHPITWRDKYHGKLAEIGSKTGQARLLVPQTFMNESGKSVAAAASFFRIEPKDILVVHDDIELSFGTIAWRTGGGLAGHNGLRSVKQSLGTGEFRRLRIGVGRPNRGSVHSWVLGRFDPIEEAALPVILEAAAKQLLGLLHDSGGVHTSNKPVTVWG